MLFGKEKDNDQNSKKRTKRDLSALLPAVLILMMIAAVIGIAAYVTQLVDSAKERTIARYTENAVTFSVIGYGSSEKAIYDEAVIEAYDNAYSEVLAKASRIASNTGKSWRIERVDEIETTKDAEGVMRSTVKLDLAVYSLND